MTRGIKIVHPERGTKTNISIAGRARRTPARGRQYCVDPLRSNRFLTSDVVEPASRITVIEV